MPQPFLRGKCAVPGIAEGRVRVIRDKSDIKSFKKGEVFVSLIQIRPLKLLRFFSFGSLGGRIYFKSG